MSYQFERPVYRIPKPVDTRLRLWGLDLRGWIAESICLVLGFGQFKIFWPHSLNGAMIHLAILAFLLGVPFMVLQDAKLFTMFYNMRYHRKHAKLLRWESDPYAVFEDIFVQEESTR